MYVCMYVCMYACARPHAHENTMQGDIHELQGDIHELQGKMHELQRVFVIFRIKTLKKGLFY